MKNILILGPWTNAPRHIQSLNNATLNIPQKAGQHVTPFCSRKRELMEVGPIPTVCHARWYDEGGWGGGREHLISRFTEQMKLRPSDRTLCAMFRWKNDGCYTPLFKLGAVLAHKWFDAWGHTLWVWVQSFLHIKLEVNNLYNHFLSTVSNEHKCAYLCSLILNCCITPKYSLLV